MEDSTRPQFLSLNPPHESWESHTSAGPCPNHEFKPRLTPFQVSWHSILADRQSNPFHEYLYQDPSYRRNKMRLRVGYRMHPGLQYQDSGLRGNGFQITSRWIESYIIRKHDWFITKTQRGKNWKASEAAIIYTTYNLLRRSHTRLTIAEWILHDVTKTYHQRVVSVAWQIYFQVAYIYQGQCQHERFWVFTYLYTSRQKAYNVALSHPFPST